MITQKRIPKFLFYLKNFIKFIRKGGVVYVNVGQLAHGEILRDKHVLVTGGSSGIGYSIAKKFLSEGANVLITGRDEQKLLNATKSLGGSISYLIWDVSNTALAHEQMQKAAEILGGIDILVNNAGAYSNVPFSSVNEKIWNTIMDTNIKGVFFICQAAAHQMIHNTNGAKIINITSIRGFEGDCTPYGISKWGANGFTKGLAREFISKNVIVNGIAPGITATEINGINVKENAYCGYEPKNNRVALPEEIAEIALFLASDAANNIVGQTIICDGGSTLV